MFSLQNYLIAI